MEHNELYELEQLREQLNLLNKKLDAQRIFSERTMVEAMRKSVSALNSMGRRFTFIGVFAVLFCPWSFYNICFSNNIVIKTAVVIAVSVLVTFISHLGLQNSDVSRGNLLELSSNVLRLKKIYSRWWFVAFPMLFVLLYLLFNEAITIFDSPEIFIIPAIVGVVIGGIIGFINHFKVIRTADKLLRQIKELKELQ